MRHLLYRFHAFTHAGHHHHFWSEFVLAIALLVLAVAAPASAAMRLQERSLYINSSEPSATTSYTISFRYMSPEAVGSVDILFCLDPIPYHECVTPPGFDASQAVLTDQTEEVGFSILSKSTNHIILTRDATMVSGNKASYTFNTVVNPSASDQAFSVRLRTHASANATGSQIDFGSIRAQVQGGVIVETQVPPMLIFCVARQVAEDCTSTDATYYTNMGELSDEETLVAQSQMAVGTNATAGFVITVHGPPPSAGTSVINGALAPTESAVGNNQFAINLVENESPAVGKNPEGTASGISVVAPGYSTPNVYKYVSGDVVAYSPNVSLMKRFTVSYILNSGATLRPGVYTTTLTYIASGRF